MNKRIAVAGSSNMDVVLGVKNAPEQGETILVNSQHFIPGGKGANRAVALARLGANPLFSCCLGGDAFGEELLKAYGNENMELSLIRKIGNEATGTAYIFVEQTGKNRISVYSGANASYGEKDISALVNRFNEISMVNAELEIPPEAVERLVKECVKADVPCVIDAGPIRDFHAEIFKGAYVLSPNESEAKALTGIEITDMNSAKECCRALYDIGVKYALIKLGSKGALCYDGSEYIISPQFDGAGKVVDTTAAGDCFMGALCFALNEGDTMAKAMHFANVAAGIAVTRKGAIPSLPHISEVRKNLYTE